MTDDYIINLGTLLLIEKKEDTTIVYEDNINFLINSKISKIINDSCKYFGSSYLGRLEGTKEIIRYKMKLPIIIEESNDLIFFPTASPRYRTVIWISFNNIKHYHRLHEKETRIIFKNDVIVDVPITYRIIENQVNRSTRLFYELNLRKKIFNCLQN